ncbi:acyP [Mytilus coruscus]|uniref:Acylphosphatase n=1 Tax=Mytilus coruscus TaxID=42192 RepID=A0A6J8C5N9_MYTCO|nr:acyP [Mytilus coruscus]
MKRQDSKRAPSQPLVQKTISKLVPKQQAERIVQKIKGPKHGDTEISQNETIEITRTKQVSRIDVNKWPPAEKQKSKISVEFEVFGKVQGVFFRKNTRKTAQSLGIVGWVKNTPQGTVQGSCEGTESKMKIMKEWLSKIGSKNSRIDKCDFKNEKSIQTFEYKSFKISH